MAEEERQTDSVFPSVLEPAPFAILDISTSFEQSYNQKSREGVV